MKQNNIPLFRLLRSISLTFVIAFGLITVVATGGGGESGVTSNGDNEEATNDGTAPQISNLVYKICHA